MALAQRIDAATDERLALYEGYGLVELRGREPIEKPPMSFRHARSIERFGRQLGRRLKPDQHLVFVESARLRVGNTSLIPDVVVIPAAIERAAFERDPNRLAVYDDPVTLVVEVWPPSTGSYDVATKLPLYRARGDREIWSVHPFERTPTAWVHDAGGAYRESVASGGVEGAALPSVRVDLAAVLG